MHLTLISYPSTFDPEIENAVPRIDGWSATRERRVARCQTPEHFLTQVASVGVPVCRLDLFGHGAPGSLILGDKQAPLMTANRSTWGRLLLLKDFLTPGAEVRLLGCETGIHPEGFDVLQGLSQQLGCTVWGAKTRIDWSDFREMGFDPKLVKDLLVSSAEMESPISSSPRPGDSMKAGLEELERLGIRVPSGYEPEGYAPMPASILDEVWENQEQKVTVTVRGQRRLIVVTASPGRHFLLRWLAPRTAPSLDALKPQLNIF